MKKLFIAILLFIVSGIAFAEHNINVLGSLIVGVNSHTSDDSVNHRNIMVNTSLGFEYLYIFDNGLSVGANTSFISESLLDITNTTPQITSDYTGNGISFAPTIGWTFRGEVSHIQLLFYPLIMESASYDERTITVRNVTSPKLKTETYLDTYKTGIASTFEWGWEHFKLGAGAGANLIFADNYNEKIESAHGLEVVFMGKATILF